VTGRVPLALREVAIVDLGCALGDTAATLLERRDRSPTAET
jgi:hypothetical protein